jgi:hypothetical protein
MMVSLLRMPLKVWAFAENALKFFGCGHGLTPSHAHPLEMRKIAYAHGAYEKAKKLQVQVLQSSLITNSDP